MKLTKRLRQQMTLAISPKSRWQTLLGLAFGASSLLAAAALSDKKSFTQVEPPAEQQPASSEKEAPRHCALQTAAAWQAFINKASDDPRWIETCEDSPCDKEAFKAIEENVYKPLLDCQEFLAQKPELQACSDRLFRFTTIWLNQHDEVSYGFAMDNPSYLQEQENPDKPRGMMEPPAFIVAALPERSAVEAAAHQHGLKSLTHDSALGGTRTYILNPDPAGRFDQWLLLNLQDNDKGLRDGTPLSVLTVQKKTANGTPLPQIRVHFRDYHIIQEQGRYQLILDEFANGKCYACHTNGVRELIERHTPVLEAKPLANEKVWTDDFPYQRLLEFNRRLRSYGSPDWDHKIHVEDHGPVLGEAQGCTSCHNGESRGTLNVSTSPAQIKRKILEELAMPPSLVSSQLLEEEQQLKKSKPLIGQHSLDATRAEHARLLQEYEASRLPLLRDWLREITCEAPKP